MAAVSITGITFTRLTDDEIVNYANVEVNRPVANVTRDKTIYDPRMGTCDNKKTCHGCLKNNVDCVGGYGRIRLPMAFYHPAHGKIIASLLNGVCSRCWHQHAPTKQTVCEKCGVGRILRIIERKSVGFVSEYYDMVEKKTLSSTEIQDFLNRLDQRESTEDLTKRLSGRCWECMQVTSAKCCGKLPKRVTEIKSPADTWEVEFYDQNSGLVLSPDAVYNLLQQKAASLKRPQLMGLMNKYAILTPICTRPYFMRNNHELQSDTSVIYNTLLRWKKRSTEGEWRSLQKELYIKMEMLQTQKKHRPLQNSNSIPKSLKCLVQGKAAWVNSKINGRRVNHASRAVITPFADGDIGFVGIPEHMAAKNTKPMYLKRIGDVFTPEGRRAIEDFIKVFRPTRIIRRHPDSDISTVFRPSTERQINYILNNIKPDEHYWVERPLRNGDVVLVNRQPSLRRESIQVMKVKILPGNTIRLVLPVTTSYNADFDGDEMNVHVIQDERACVEALLLLSTERLIISSQKGTPIIYPVQDCIIGLYVMSGGPSVSMSFLDNLAVSLGDVDTTARRAEWYEINPDKSHLDARFAISLCFDSRFDYRLNQDDLVYEIRRGTIVIDKTTSRLSADILRGGIKSIIHQYIFLLGSRAVVDFYSRLERATHLFLEMYGFTIGVQDCIGPKMPLPDKIDPNTILGTMENKCRADVALTGLGDMILSGAKASMTNAVQIKQVLGQQSVDGCNLLKEMKTRRILPYFQPRRKVKSCRGVFVKEEDDIVGLGFIRESFSDGLKKSSMQLHCKAGWRGVGDSVTKVADTGYTTKKLTKNLENLVVAYDMTIRDMESNRIIQYLVGGDGMDPSKLPADNSADGVYRKTFFTKRELQECGITCIGKFARALYHCRYGVSQGGDSDTLIVKQLKKIILNRMTKILDPCDENCNDDLLASASEELSKKLFCRSFQPGDAIGLLTGTNFGEITTQLLLKSFHHSGIKTKNISGGIRRLKQLLDRTSKACKDNVVCARVSENCYNTLRLAYRYAKNSHVKAAFKCLLEQHACRLACRIRRVTFGDINDTVIISSCANPTCSVFTCPHVGNPGNYTLTYKCQVVVLEYNIAAVMPYLVAVDNTTFRATFEGSLEDALKFNRKVLSKSLLSTAYDNVEVFFDDSRDDFELVFKGVPMDRVMLIEFVDKNTVVSNDVYEVEEIYGIEGARRCLMDEIQRVLSFDGANIDRRFVDIICDNMAYRGKMACIKNNSTSVLTNAFFEHEVKKWNSYSLTNAKDPCKSVESSVILGTACKLGTNYFDIVDPKTNKLVSC